MKLAIVNAGVVDNVELWDDDTKPPDGAVVLADGQPCSPGWLYNGKAFFAPPPTADEMRAAELGQLIGAMGVAIATNAVWLQSAAPTDVSGVVAQVVALTQQVNDILAITTQYLADLP